MSDNTVNRLFISIQRSHPQLMPEIHQLANGESVIRFRARVGRKLRTTFIFWHLYDWQFYQENYLEGQAA